MIDALPLFTCTGCLNYSWKKHECRLGLTDDLAIFCKDYELKECDRPRKEDTKLLSKLHLL